MRPRDPSLTPVSDDYAALEPAISGKIMELHHSKHHQTYVNGFNAAVEALSEAQAKNDAKAAAAQAPLLNFHGGGHVNHSLFWENLAPNGKGGGGEPAGKLSVCGARVAIFLIGLATRLTLSFTDGYYRGLWLFRQPKEAD